MSWKTITQLTLTPLTHYYPALTGLIAGGSGIAPLLQILRVIRDNKDDHTEIWLIFSNSTEDDMFLQEELESYLAEQPDKFHLHCTISRPSVGWITVSDILLQQQQLLLQLLQL